MAEETAEQFVERMAHLVRITFQEEGIRWEFQRLCNLALRGAETQWRPIDPKNPEEQVLVTCPCGPGLEGFWDYFPVYAWATRDVDAICERGAFCIPLTALGEPKDE